MLKQTESKNIFVVMYIAILSQIETPVNISWCLLKKGYMDAHNLPIIQNKLFGANNIWKLKFQKILIPKVNLEMNL